MDAPRIAAFACLVAGLALLGLTMFLPWSDGQTELGTPEYRLWSYQDGDFKASYFAKEADAVKEGRGLLATSGPLLAASIAAGLVASVLLLLNRGRAGMVILGFGIGLLGLGMALAMVGIRRSTKAIGGEYSWESSVYLASAAALLLIGAAVASWWVRPPPKKVRPVHIGPITFRMRSPPPARQFTVETNEPGPDKARIGRPPAR